MVPYILPSIMRKLPIGVQGFESLRNDGYLYVDKTEYIYRLVKSGKSFFLSRPRRFGKSLFLSALKAYWEGKRRLFDGLKISELMEKNAENWEPRPVFYFDFTGENYRDHSGLEEILDEHLRRWEVEYDIREIKGSLGARFRSLLSKAKEKSGHRSVVLVDEYDKPLLDVMDDNALEEKNKALFKGFFSTLKGYDDYLEFVFITGVTKFERVSIFSDLNQLRDISLSGEYAEICGISEKELLDVFGPEITALAGKQGMGFEECTERLRKTYDGYRFHPESAGVYNPLSLLTAFADGDFGSYWFSTGTPTFLVNKVKEVDFDLRKLSDRTLYAGEAMLTDHRADDPNPVPLLYQAGYLTIAGFDSQKRRYTLCFPNEEVKYGFYESLLPAYAPAGTGGTGADIFTLDEYVENGNTEGIRNVLTVPTLR